MRAMSLMYIRIAEVVVVVLLATGQVLGTDVSVVRDGTNVVYRVGSMKSFLCIDDMVEYVCAHDEYKHLVNIRIRSDDFRACDLYNIADKLHLCNAKRIIINIQFVGIADYYKNISLVIVEGVKAYIPDDNKQLNYVELVESVTNQRIMHFDVAGALINFRYHGDEGPVGHGVFGEPLHDKLTNDPNGIP